MKKALRTLTIFLIVGALVAVSCKKKDTKSTSNNTTTSGTTSGSTTGGTTGGTTTGGTTTGGSMSVQKNGAAWAATGVSAVFTIDQDNDMSALVINGSTSADIIAIAAEFPSASATMPTGSHTLDDTGLVSYSTKTSGGGTLTEHIPDECIVTITSVDNTNKKVSGTFSALMHKVGSNAPSDSLKFAGGVFTNISYIVVQQ